MGHKVGALTDRSSVFIRRGREGDPCKPDPDPAGTPTSDVHPADREK